MPKSERNPKCEGRMGSVLFRISAFGFRICSAMFLNSIRWRLQLWHGLLLVLVLAGFGVTAYQLQSSSQLRRIDQELQHRIAVIGGVMRRPGEGPGRLPPFERPPDREFPPRVQIDGPERASQEPRASEPRPGRPFPPEREREQPLPLPFAGRQRPGDGPPLPRELRLSTQDMRLFEGPAS